MAAATLNPVEQRVLTGALSGTRCELGPSVPAPGDLQRTVSADFLRKVLLGAGGWVTHGQSIVSIHLRGVLVEGSIDLRDCCAPGGAALPPLLLDYCRLAGDAADRSKPSLTARHAHLARLSLTGCRAGRIDLNNSVIDGDLAIDELEALAPDDACQVTGRRSRIRGLVNARRARLRIPLDQRIPAFGVPDSALDLSGACIEDGILLLGGFVAEGGVNVANARIEGDIWATSARLVAGAGDAFRGQHLRCHGVVGLNGSEADPFVALGGVALLGAEIGILYMENFRLEPRQGKPDVAAQLALTGSRIHGHVVLSTDRDTSAGRRVQLVANNLQAEGDFQVRGDFSGANLSGATLDRNVEFAGSSPQLMLDQARIGGHLTVRLSSQRALELAARNAEIGGNCELAQFAGGAWLSTARISGNLMIDAVSITHLDGRDLDVTGLVELKGIARPTSARQGLRFDGGHYRGEFRIDQLEIQQSGSDQPELSIDDARIERDLRVRGLRAGRAPLLELAGAQALRCRSGSLSFYSRWELTEILVRLPGNLMALLALLRDKKGGPELFLLNGTVHPISQINLKDRPRLADEATVADYLRFFCSYVWGDGGAFRVIESEAEVSVFGPAALTPGLTEETRPRPVSVRALGQGKWGAVAWIWYQDAIGAPVEQAATTAAAIEPTVLSSAGTIFKARFVIHAAGQVEMLDDQAVAQVKVAHPEEYKPPTRILPKETRVEGVEEKAWWVSRLSRGPVQELAVSIAAELLSRLASGEGSVQGRAGAILSLKGLRAGALSHAWRDDLGEDIQLRLEGFQFDRVEIEPEADLLPARPASLEQGFGKAATGSPVRRSADVLARFHTDWLLKQFPGSNPRNLAAEDAFTPQPYEQMASVLRAHGSVDEARLVTLERLRLESKLAQRLPQQIANWVMDVFFSHGLSSVRVFYWCIGLLLAGVLVFDAANYGRARWLPGQPVVFAEPLLVLDAAAITILSQAAADGTGAPIALMAPANGPTPPELRCGEQIDPLIYTLDVFLPLPDFRQEEKCAASTRPDATWFRWFKALYSIIGSIFTSMLVLSLTGVIKRWTER